MRVCIDIQSAISQRAGVGRYTRLLVERLASLVAAPDELALFYFDFQRKGVPFPVPGASRRACRWIPGRIVQTAWKTVGWPAFDVFAGRADLFHFPNFIRPPLARGRSIVTIHDVAFLRMPETIEEKNYRHLTARIRETVDRADAVIAVSEFTRREIIELLGVPPAKVVAIRSGIEPPRAPREIPDPGSRIPIFPSPPVHRPFLFTVGTLEPRKNYPFLIDVFDRLDFDGDLVIAGGHGWKYEPILERVSRSPRRDRIRILRYVTDEELERLYSACALFVFPSRYEGFGFPPLEAMARGAPVVSAATGSLPEVLGDAALLLDGFDPEAWAATVDRLLADETARRELAARGPAQAAKFTWDETARRTWELYRAV